MRRRERRPAARLVGPAGADGELRADRGRPRRAGSEGAQAHLRPLGALRHPGLGARARPGADADTLPDGTREGKNDRGATGYTGPCPPIGRHRYFFKLYALDAELGDLGEPTKQELERAIEGHVLERAEVVGTYERGAAAGGGR